MAFIVIVLEDKKRSRSIIYHLQTLLYSKTDPSYSMDLEKDKAPILAIYAGICLQKNSHENPAFLTHPCQEHFTNPKSPIKIGRSDCDFTTARNRIRAEVEANAKADSDKDKLWGDVKASEPLTR